MDATQNKMEHMEIKQLVISMSLPIIISMVIQALYNIVDSIFVAKISSDALTAVSLCYPVQTIMVAIACGTAVGFNTLLARYLGEKKFDYANNTMMHGILLGFLNGIVFLVLGLLFSNVFLSWFTSDSNVVSLANTYIRICTMFSFSIFVQIIFERVMQATGNAIYNMVMQGAGAIINIILDPILIFGWFGLPRMGVTGAAIATVIGQFSAASLAFVLFKKYNTHLHISFKKFRVDFHVIFQLYSIAIPSSVMMCLPSVLVSLLNGILSSISQSAVAFFGVYYKLQTFIYMPTSGIVQGMRPLMSYNYGAKLKERMHQILKVSGLVIAAILGAGTLLFFIVPNVLLSLFNASSGMLEIGETGLRILSLSFIVSSFGVLMSGVFEALGLGKYSLIVSLLRQLLITVPLAYILLNIMGIEGIWLSFVIAEAIASIVAYILYRKKFKTI